MRGRAALRAVGWNEWMGMAARTTLGTGGIGLTRTRVFDAQGVCGRSLHTLFVARR